MFADPSGWDSVVAPLTSSPAATGVALLTDRGTLLLATGDFAEVGFGRIVVSEIQAPNMVVNLV
jgi:hypothetical protein